MCEAWSFERNSRSIVQEACNRERESGELSSRSIHIPYLCGVVCRVQLKVLDHWKLWFPCLEAIAVERSSAASAIPGMAATLTAAVSSGSGSGRDCETFDPLIFGLERWSLAATFLSAWDYALLLVVLSIIFVCYFLDVHIVGDVLRGWRGDAVGLFYDPKSPVSARLVAKCGTLKKRYWPTPWLCSPHLQTLFLHFIGLSPAVEYQRQLYITSDGGTIALDWVKPPAVSVDGSGETRRKDSDSDETPTVIIVPGLTSHSGDHYVKHAARRCSDNGWRVLVANHRGLGGVSITSDQLYNAGWTEDLRKIILLVKQTYPKSPLLAIGTSLGANILVKYLGEEGPRTPLGGAVAICCPWDLLVCDRFMARIGVQFLYCRALVIGLRQYALLHQTALSRLVDWNLVTKANSIREFDDAVTRHVGKYETVDTYYRRCSSSLFVESIAIPLLCISAEDDPICTKEAIPYDECRLNPNIILGVTGHGGHLAYYEGFDATSIWWVRAATEFARVLLSSSLMHQQRNVSVPSTKLGANIDQGPFLTMTESHQVAAQDSGCDGDFVTVAQASQSQLSKPDTEIPQREKGIPMDKGSSVASEKSTALGPLRTLKVNDTHEASIPAYDTGDRPISTDVQLEAHPSVTLHLRSSSEVAALRSALSQLLDQVPLPSSIAEETRRLGSKPSSNSPNTHAGQSRTIEIPIGESVVADFGNCVEATKDLLVSNDSTDKRNGASASEQHQNHPMLNKDEASGQLNLMRDFAGLRSQNRRTLWLLTNAWRHYVVSNRFQHFEFSFERALAEEASVSANQSQPEYAKATEVSLLVQPEVKVDCFTGQITTRKDASDANSFLDQSSRPSIHTLALEECRPGEVTIFCNIPKPLEVPSKDSHHVMDGETSIEDSASCSTHGIDSPGPRSSCFTPCSNCSELDSVLKPIRSRFLPTFVRKHGEFALSPSILLPSFCRNRIGSISSPSRDAESRNPNFPKDNVDQCLGIPLENVSTAQSTRSPSRETSGRVCTKKWTSRTRHSHPSLPLKKACTETIGRLSSKVNIFRARDLPRRAGTAQVGAITDTVGKCWMRSSGSSLSQKKKI